MLIAIIPSVIGFILIFVHFRNDAGLITFGVRMEIYIHLYIYICTHAGLVIDLYYCLILSV